MVLTPSTMIDLGRTAPDFKLPNIDGQVISRDQAKGNQGLLVAFLCNHCPYVKHIADDFGRIAAELISQGVGVVAINSNDAEAYPDDSPAQMVVEAKQRGYTFPYLFDETQEVAKAYEAACTPDFFLFDQDLSLYYRGQLDGSRPNQTEPVTGIDLKNAVEALTRGDTPPNPQTPSIGCNIKWRPGQAPAYFTRS